jgi:hypothetical protein
MWKSLVAGVEPPGNNFMIFLILAKNGHFDSNYVLLFMYAEKYIILVLKNAQFCPE